MGKTLGFSVSSSANLSPVAYSRVACVQLSKPPTRNRLLRRPLHWTAGKRELHEFLNLRVLPSAARESSTRAEEIRRGLDAATLDPASHSSHVVTSSHVEKAWEHWNRLGAPKLIVAPMMDQSELPFRMLCRKYGATGAYTPMFHSRPFALQAGYRRVEFTTCPEDRPLFVQFGANDPQLLLKAAMLVQEHCDYIDINLGCPQRVAKRGRYGAFLMDDLPLIQTMVTELAGNLTTPVSCKIRIYPDLDDTLAYACMLQDAGCSLLAVHGRTRDQKDGRATRADWEAIKAVKSAVRIPVLANGNIRWLEDVDDCVRATGVDGVMSAESLLENPALFAGHRMQPVEEVTGSVGELSREGALNEPSLALEYLNLCEQYPVTKKMIRAHVYKLLVGWFARYPELRDELNGAQRADIDWIRGLVYRLLERHVSVQHGIHASEGAATSRAEIGLQKSKEEKHGYTLTSFI